MLDLAKIKEQVAAVTQEVLEAAKHTQPGDFFVLGCSSSEIHGSKIGQDSKLEIGQAVIEAILPLLQERGLNLAVQGCEHINRALSVERASLKSHQLTEVNVKPDLHAGGAASVAAWELFANPVCVEHLEASLGLDIGDTEIGMHIKHVQKPFRPQTKYVGEARVTALVYRPKLIGGDRAVHL
ncbi:MAG: TIGR01440 family protein [Eubacteriales bacterium]|nr:TIGR01440 family protein [Eubacteriales bacterium]